MTDTVAQTCSGAPSIRRTEPCRTAARPAGRLPAWALAFALVVAPIFHPMAAAQTAPGLKTPQEISKEAEQKAAKEKVAREEAERKLRELQRQVDELRELASEAEEAAERQRQLQLRSAPLPQSAKVAVPRRSDLPQMIAIPAGSFGLGSPLSEQRFSSYEAESPQRNVKVAAFALGRTEVTVGQFRRFVQISGYKTEAERGVGCAIREAGKWEFRAGFEWRNPGFAQGDDHPVVCVSWSDAQAYVQWLSQATGEAYRLPTEAEWEYAARAGKGTRYYWGQDSDKICEYANVADAAAKSTWNPTWPTAVCNDDHAYTAPVGKRLANGWGLRDVSGNVWEWTEDCWNGNYRGDPPIDGSAWQTGDCAKRVIRGGGWLESPWNARSAVRSAQFTSVATQATGFRVAGTLQ
jgi:formylglycine-generating enzyme required for sulfatase activity